jgi:hypothetical protein
MAITPHSRWSSPQKSRNEQEETCLSIGDSRKQVVKSIESQCEYQDYQGDIIYHPDSLLPRQFLLPSCCWFRVRHLGLQQYPWVRFPKGLRRETPSDIPIGVFHSRSNVNCLVGSIRIVFTHRKRREPRLGRTAKGFCHTFDFDPVRPSRTQFAPYGHYTRNGSFRTPQIFSPEIDCL